MDESTEIRTVPNSAIPLAVFVLNHFLSNSYSVLKLRQIWKLTQLLWQWRSPNCYDVHQSFFLRVYVCVGVGVINFSVCKLKKKKQKEKTSINFCKFNLTRSIEMPKENSIRFNRINTNHLITILQKMWITHSCLVSFRRNF